MSLGLLPAVLMMVALVTVPAFAGELILSEFKCRLTLPDGWEETNDPIGVYVYEPKEGKLAVVAKDMDRRRTFIMTVADAGRRFTIDSVVIRSVHRAIENMGWTITGGLPGMIAGVDAYVIDGEFPSLTPLPRMHMVTAAANGRLYTLIFVDDRDRVPTDDPDVRTILAGFSFIGEPEIHRPVYRGPAREMIFKDKGCAINLPTGWDSVSYGHSGVEGRLLMAGDSLSERGISIYAKSVPPKSGIGDKHIIEHVMGSLLAPGVRFLDANPMTLAGEDAVSLRAALDSGGAGYIVQVIALVNDTTLYTIGGFSKASRDPTTDRELQRVINSFRLLHRKVKAPRVKFKQLVLPKAKEER